MPLLSNFIVVWRRLRKVKRISGELGQTDFRLERMLERADKHDQALRDLYDVIQSDRSLSHLSIDLGLDRERVLEVYESLIANGAGQWIRGHFVPVSALTLEDTLVYCVKGAALGLSMAEICFNLVEYFSGKKVKIREFANENYLYANEPTKSQPTKV